MRSASVQEARVELDRLLRAWRMLDRQLLRASRVEGRERPRHPNATAASAGGGEHGGRRVAAS